MAFKGKKIKTGWLVAFLIMAAVSVSELFTSSGEGLFGLGCDHLYVNVAWMITATIFVLLMVFGYTFVMNYALYWLTNKIIPLRVSRHNEEIGLDLSQHGEEYGAEAGTGIAEDLPSDAEWFSRME